MESILNIVRMIRAEPSLRSSFTDEIDEYERERTRNDEQLVQSRRGGSRRKYRRRTRRRYFHVKK